MKTTYDGTMQMDAARDRYFSVNGFGTDGGYGDAWVDFKLGPLPMPFPNTPGRVRAVAYHDLHHVLTGYDTDTLGEFEISAWEIGAGCGKFATAWAINLGGMLAGLVAAPRRTVRAFFRGRRNATLYGRALATVLPMQVEDARRLIVVDEARPVGARDVAALVGFSAAGLVVGTLMMGLVVPLVPVGLVTHALRRRAKSP